jgi:nucleotide-binding universal stress UspA family protein
MTSNPSPEIFLVAYDGDDFRVADYAAACAVKSGAALHVVHVLEWSPFSFLTPEEIEERHRKRTEELNRANDDVMRPVLERLRETGVKAEGEVRHGEVVSILCDIAKKRNVEKLFAGRNGAQGLAARMFGSTAIGLVQASPVPVVIVP